jgi:hypothetical protein
MNESKKPQPINVETVQPTATINVTRMDESVNTFLKDIVYEDFVSILTVENIKQFNSECKKKHMNIRQNKNENSPNGNAGKLSKDNFLNIMYSVFNSEYKKSDKKENFLINTGNNSYSYANNSNINMSKKDDIKEKSLLALFDKMFNRFKITKCEVKSEKYKPTNISNLINNNVYPEYYYINEITNDIQEIDTYEFTCALCIFLKIDFREKMKLLFDVADVDEDGYINENEIKNMIFVVNFIFCDEESPHKTNSSIINQSLVTIKTQQVFNMIMKHPGELYKVITVERYVNFDQFYNSISKIENFKYSIIPTFVNLKNSLNVRKSEPEYEMDKKNLNEYLSIMNEILTCVKNTNNEIVKNKNKDIKKLIDSKSENKLENAIKKNRNFVEENKKSISGVRKYNSIHNSQKINPNNEIENFNSYNSYNYENTINTATNLPLITSNLRLQKINDKPNSLSKNILFNINMSNNNNETYSVNYNKILNLETQPGKIKIRDNNSIPLSKEIMTSVNKTENSTLEKESKDMNKVLTSRILYHTLKEFNNTNNDKKKNYISYNDIMSEIKLLSRKNHFANYEDTEEVKKMINDAKDTAMTLINKLKDSAPNSGYLSFGKCDYKK